MIDSGTKPVADRQHASSIATPEARPAPMGLDDPRAIQILATEHWSLLASRTLSWNESFSRASMLLATLSATVVALALVAQAADFGQGFIVFALVVLPFVELVGLATFARLGEANIEDALFIQGMNRIRHAYLEIAPQLEPYFVTSAHDDLAAILSTYGALPLSRSATRSGLRHGFVMTQGMVGIINAMVAAVFGALFAVQAGSSTAIAVGAGGLFFAVALGAHLRYGLSTFQRMNDRMTYHFPSPPGAYAVRSPEKQTKAPDRTVPPAPSELERWQTQLEFVPRLRDYPWRLEQPDGRLPGVVRHRSIHGQAGEPDERRSGRPRRADEPAISPRDSGGRRPAS